ncbi:MAG: TetR/AcrR family transcriptional regulator [Coriobacteriia bacterium]|nr:TetR/AcrR family transcriptional regulator [Coriobacteriia bacterium]
MTDNTVFTSSNIDSVVVDGIIDVAATVLSDSRPLPETTTLDRRSLRSRRMMREAVADLISEQGLGNFTVADLMQKADLNRSTFYSHYSDLDDLMLTLKQEIRDDLDSIRPHILSVTLKDVLAFELAGTPPSVTILLFDTLREHGHLLRVLLCPNGDAQFQAELRDEFCADVIRSILHEKYTRNPNALVDYYVSYYSSAMHGLIRRWLEGGMQEDSHEMARIMLSIMFLKPGDSIKLKGAR